VDGDKSELPDRIDVGVAARQVWNLYQQANGATFNLYSGSLAGKNLFAVSVYSDRTRDVDEADFSPDMIEVFIRANLDLLAQNENSVGIWLATDEGKVYLDVSLTIPDRQRALELAREHREQAICHLSNLTVEYAESE